MTVGAECEYELEGTVKKDGDGRDTLGAVILPSDNENYLEFPFLSSKPEGGFYNGVFYIRLIDHGAAAVAAIVVESIVKNLPIVITFKRLAPWDPIRDPGGIVVNARLAA